MAGVTGAPPLFLASVIRVPGEPRGGPVQLLGEQHLRERVRQRERGQAQQQRRAPPCLVVQPVGLRLARRPSFEFGTGEAASA